MKTKYKTLVLFTPLFFALGAANYDPGTGRNVKGPASSTDNAVTRFDGTDGKTVQNSTATVDDSGNLSTNTVEGTQVGGGNSSGVRSTSAGPAIEIRETDGALDEKSWDFLAGSGQLLFRTVNDANSASDSYIEVKRTGITVDSVEFPNGNVGMGIIDPIDMLQVEGEGARADINFAKFGGSIDLHLKTASGTQASPTATGTGADIARITSFSHDGTSFGTSSGQIKFMTTEAQTSTNRGGHMIFRTIPNGSTTLSDRMTIDQNGFVGIGASPATSALLDLTSTTGALLVSRMTTTQRDALTAVDGMMIYNSTTARLERRVSGAWVGDPDAVLDLKTSAEAPAAVFSGSPDIKNSLWNATDTQGYVEVVGTVAADKGGLVFNFVVPDEITTLDKIAVTAKLGTASQNAIVIRVKDTGGTQVGGPVTITAATKTTVTLTSFSPTPVLTAEGKITVEVEGEVDVGETAFLGDVLAIFGSF